MPKLAIIVEDDVLSMKLHTDILEASGYTVVQSSDGKNIIELVAMVMPDLILMDIMLPGISGADHIKKIKDNNELKHIPIVAISAMDYGEIKPQVYKNGCDAFISKPIIYQKFLQTIEDCALKNAAFFKNKSTISSPVLVN